MPCDIPILYPWPMASPFWLVASTPRQTLSAASHHQQCCNGCRSPGCWRRPRHRTAWEATSDEEMCCKPPVHQSFNRFIHKWTIFSTLLWFYPRDMACVCIRRDLNIHVQVYEIVCSSSVPVWNLQYSSVETFLTIWSHPFFFGVQFWTIPKLDDMGWRERNRRDCHSELGLISSQISDVPSCETRLG